MSEPNLPDRALWIGDNLDVVRCINGETVDLVYLDPPFNAGRTFSAPLDSDAAGASFNDMWHMDAVQAERWHLYEDAGSPELLSVIDAAERVHSSQMAAYLIFMADRVVDLYRVLKPTGSLWLHCDDTAGPYLRLLLDAVFGASRLGAEIVWKRQSSNNSVKQGFGRNTDRLLWYTKTSRYTWNPVYHERSEAEMAEYRKDTDGRLYKCDDLTTPGARPERQFAWRGAQPSASRSWKADEGDLEEMLARGEIELKADGTAKLRGWKRYLDEAAPGQKCQVLWTDIERVGNTSKERSGWPTQKPLALLERVIAASSNEGDLILDPFCGCATACVAAERLGRRWWGIDIDEAAAQITESRLRDETDRIDPEHRTMGMFGTGGVFHPLEVPLVERTDLEDPASKRTPNKELRRLLWSDLVPHDDGERRHCPPCGKAKHFEDFELDHIRPRNEGGADTDSNLHLICCHCTGRKGSRTMSELMSIIEADHNQGKLL